MRLLPSDIPAPFPSTCGLKARATLAWGKAPGPLPSANRGLKARAKRLIPYKPLIKRHTILRKHRPHLGLKIAPLMMLCLPIDIPHQRRTITQPNRKCRIPALPSEPRKLRSLRLDPLRRRNFHPLHHARNCLRPSQAHRHMHMVGNPAHPHTDILGTVQNRCQIPMQLRPHPLGQRRPAPLHTEDNMHQHNRERLRHPAHANKLRHATLSHLRITAALLLFLLAPTLTFAQTPPPHTLTIRILNARTNKPVLDENLNVTLRADEPGGGTLPTDKNGLILVDIGPATTIRILSNRYADCRSRAELYTTTPSTPSSRPASPLAISAAMSARHRAPASSSSSRSQEPLSPPMATHPPAPCRTRTKTQTSPVLPQRTDNQLAAKRQQRRANPMLHTFVALVQDKPGVLTRDRLRGRVN